MKWTWSAILIVMSCAMGALAQNKASLATQKMCSEQAQKLNGTDVSVMTNHYNKTMNKCFARTVENLKDEQDKIVLTGNEIEDAFEGTIYGACFWDPNLKISYCWVVNPDTGKQMKADSLDDWGNLASIYMSD